MTWVDACPDKLVKPAGATYQTVKLQIDVEMLNPLNSIEAEKRMLIST